MHLTVVFNDNYVYRYSFSLAKARRICCGDPRQLPAFCHARWHTKTCMRNLLDSHNSLLLTTQYRQHPVMSAFANYFFYEGELTSVVESKRRKTACPVKCFVWNKILLPDEVRSSSVEADIINKLYIMLNWNAVDSAIICCYKPQLEVLRKILPKGTSIKIPDSFQGGEIDNCIQSLQALQPSIILKFSFFLNIHQTSYKKI